MSFFESIERFEDRIAVISKEQTFSYRDFVEQADEVAKNMGDRKLVFLVCTNTIESLLSYVGCLRNDIVPLMVQVSTGEDAFNNLIECYKPAFILQPVGFSKGTAVKKYGSYEMIKTKYNTCQLHPDLGLLLTTSGSTGSIKFVRQSYKNIKSNAESIVEYLKIVPEDRAITTLPMHYTYGLSIINSHLMSGASLVITEAGLMEKEFWSLVKTNSVNNFGGVPYTYEMLKKLRFSHMDVSSLRYLTQAGGKLGTALHKEFAEICKEKGIDLVIMYGQTEATARMSYLSPEYSLSKAGSIGKAIPGGEFLLIDDNGDIIQEPGVVGELVYRGANVTMGYAQCLNDLSKDDEWSGELKTGDMAFFDADGFFYISGRKKRFLKVFGNRVNLDEIDSLLREQGYEAVSSGEDNNVVIYSVDGGEGIIDFLAEKTGLNRHAFSVRYIKEIPRNSAGKIVFAELK